MRAEEGGDGKRSALLLAALTFELLVVGLWAARRGVNADEGFYLAAARAVSEGLTLYRDVFFPQMPYLPWGLAGLFGFAPPSLELGRSLSVVGAALSAALLADAAWRLERHSGAVIGAVLLYGLSAVLLSGLSVVKSASLVNACLLAAFVPLAFGGARRAGWAFAAGCAAGTAVGLRLAVAPLVVLFAGLALCLGRRSLAAFAGGGLLASLPWLLLAARSPDAFWFCNVTFHALRREIAGLGPILLQKGGVLAKWLFLPQHMVLWGLAAVGLWRAPSKVWPAAASAALLAVTYLAATPTYLEYMTQIVPFVILTAVPALAVLTERRAAAALVLGAYLLGLYPLFKTAAPASVTGLKRSLWQRGQVEKVSDAIRRRTAVGDPVLSWWEGFPVLAGRPGFRGVGFWESNVAKKLDRARAKRYHLAQAEDLEALIARREPALIVVADGVWQGLRPAIDRGYVVAERIGAVQVYSRSGAD